jgi:hypothetical protein
MIRGIFFLLIACGFVGCAKYEFHVRVGGPSISLFTGVKGSPDCPIVDAGEAEADQTLRIYVTHIPSGTNIDGDHRVRLDRSKVWTRTKSGDAWFTRDGAIFIAGQPAGIEVRVHFTPAKDSSSKVEETETFVVPFGADISGAKGSFRYEAKWKKG